MKCFLALITLILFTGAVLAQKRVVFSNDSDTVFWYQYKNNYSKQFHLGSIEEDTNDYTFRFWAFGLVIKVTHKANEHAGEIIRFVEAYPKGKKTRKFVKHYPISSAKAIEIRNLIDSLQIEVLPSDKKIKGWQQGLDGVEYFTEVKKDGQYSFKNYWTPTAQDTLKEAILFQNFVAGLSRILELKTNGKDFENDIPFDGWSYPGGAGAVIRAKKKNGG